VTLRRTEGKKVFPIWTLSRLQVAVFALILSITINVTQARYIQKLLGTTEDAQSKGGLRSGSVLPAFVAKVLQVKNS
jgi:hypothetical protein